jgi:hypothetical protein
MEVIMEYISTYLRNYAWKYREDNHWIMDTVTNTYGNTVSQYAVNHNLPMILNEAADEIDRLRKKIKELERIQRIIDLANQSE